MRERRTECRRGKEGREGRENVKVRKNKIDKKKDK